MYAPNIENYFKGVCPDNLLRFKKEQSDIYVVNMQPSHRQGEHWVIVENTPPKILCFDPYGLAPRDEIVKGLKETLALNGKKLYHH